MGRRDASRWSEPKSQNTEEPVTMHGKKDPSRCTGPIGGTDTGWLAEGVHDLDPQYRRPGEPAIANHLTRHEVHDHVSRRLLASDAGNRSPRTLRRRSQSPFKISLPLPQQSATSAARYKLQEESNSLVLVGRHPRMALASARCPNKSTTDTDNDHLSRQFYLRGSH